MDEFNFDDDSDLDDAEDRENRSDERAILRVTITGGTITAIFWSPRLVNHGPLTSLMRDRERERVAIADVYILGGSDPEREAVVEFMAAGSVRAAAQRALRRWANELGYTRIWFPDGPVDLPGPPPGPRTAIVACGVCGAEFVDSTPAFWQLVRGWGHFPTQCIVCGGFLPQWNVRSGDLTRCRGSVRAGRGARSRAAPPPHSRLAA
jgi:hypothetical protein